LIDSYVGEKKRILDPKIYSAPLVSVRPFMVQMEHILKLRLLSQSALFIVMLVLAGVGCNSVGPTAIFTQPSNQTVVQLQHATFRVIVNGGEDVTFQWMKNGAPIPGATDALYITPPATLADSGGKFSVAVISGHSTLTSQEATLAVMPGVDVVTYHYENMRMGQNTSEPILSPKVVSTATFGLVGTVAVDGLVDAQPLYLSDVTIPTVGARNVLYVATEHGTVFAFDADSTAGSASSMLWKTSTLLPGETTSDDFGCNSITPEIGITATPVIDRALGAIYVVAMSKDSSGNHYQRIHALDLVTGKELFGGPTSITASYPGTGANSSGGIVPFDPALYDERAALIEVNGAIYTTWASHCDLGPYTSWVIGYSATTLKQSSVLNLVPNGSKGGIWMSAAGPAADSAGNLYIILGNGDFDNTLDNNGFPQFRDYGNCYVKLSTSPTLAVLDYFTPADTDAESQKDFDFGSGGPLLLPDLVDGDGRTQHLAVGAGKEVNLYVLNRDNLGKFNTMGDQIYQELQGAIAGINFSAPAYFNGSLYYGSASDSLKAFPTQNASIPVTPSSQSANKFPYPGTTPTVSADGSQSGIVWTIENGTVAHLRAYDATNLVTELYSSGDTNGRDDFGGNKFITPVVANGRVYVGTPTGVAVFGLLP
jgi:hypothetical protein